MAKKKKNPVTTWVKRLAALFMLFLMLFGVFWAARSAFIQNEPTSSKKAQQSSAKADTPIAELILTNGESYILPGTDTISKNPETVKSIVRQSDGSYIITKPDDQTRVKVFKNQVRQVIHEK